MYNKKLYKQVIHKICLTISETSNLLQNFITKLEQKQLNC